jgi:hypothetical protein
MGVLSADDLELLDDVCGAGDEEGSEAAGEGQIICKFSAFADEDIIQSKVAAKQTL